jgi:hypothetical protein
MSTRVCRLFAFGLLLFAGYAVAESVYKSTMPDGKVRYGPEPEPDATKVEKLTPNTQDSGVHLSTPEQKRQLDQRQSQQLDDIARHRAELDQLKAALKQAEAERDAAREVHDGDTTGNAKGGARLNEDYWERQKTLEAAVKDARKRLEDAQQGH